MVTEPKLRVAVIGVTGLGGSHTALELIRRGHTVIGISRTPAKFGVHDLYIPRPLDIVKATYQDIADALADVDAVVNSYGPHSSYDNTGLKYQPFVELTRKILLGAKRVKTKPYFVMIGGTCSLLVPGKDQVYALESPNFWVAYTRGMADSEGHTAYMEYLFGDAGKVLRHYREVRLRQKAGTASEEDNKWALDYERSLEEADFFIDFVTACRLTLMFFETNTSFDWTFISPPPLYRSGKRTGSYVAKDDYLPVTGDKNDVPDLNGRLEGISAFDLGLAIAEDIETHEHKWQHWTAVGDLSDDSFAKPHLTLADL